MATSSKSNLDAEVLSFVRRASQLLEPVDDDDNRLQEVCGTLIEQVRGHEVACARHVFGCSVMQRAIGVGTGAQRAAIAAPLLRSKQPLALLTDKYASHVLEAVLAQVLPSLHTGAADVADASGEEADRAYSLAASLVAFADTLLAERARALLEAMRDQYGTHVVRGLLLVLGGRRFLPPSSEWDGQGGGGKGGDAGKGDGGKGGRGGKGSGGGKGGKGGKGGGGKGGGGWVADGGAEEPRTKVPASFTRALERIATTLVELDDATVEAEDWDEKSGDGGGAGGGGVGGVLYRMSWHASASPVLQGLLRALPPDAEPLHRLCGRLLQWPSASAAGAGKEGPRPSERAIAHVHSMATDRGGSHLLEAVLSSCPGWWWPLYAHVFRGDLCRLGSHPVANFGTQALLCGAPNAPAFGKLLKELLPALPTLLESRPGASLVLTMAREALKHSSGGKELVRGLRAAVAPPPSATTGAAADNGAAAAAAAAASGASFLTALLAIGAPPGGGGGGGYAGGEGVVVGAVGTRLVQALAGLSAGAADPLLASAAALPPAQVASLAVNAQGSRALEALLSSPCGAAARLILSNSICESAARLARDRSGSHVLEAAFKGSAVDKRSKVLEALAIIEGDLRSSAHGGALLQKLRFDHWRHHYDSWEKGEQRSRTARTAFSDLLVPEPTPTAAAGANKPREPPPLPAGNRARTAERAPPATALPATARVREPANDDDDDDDMGEALANDMGELDAIFDHAPTTAGTKKAKRATAPTTPAAPAAPAAAAPAKPAPAAEPARMRPSTAPLATKPPPPAAPAAPGKPAAGQGLSGFAKKRRKLAGGSAGGAGGAGGSGAVDLLPSEDAEMARAHGGAWALGGEHSAKTAKKRDAAAGMQDPAKAVADRAARLAALLQQQGGDGAGSGEGGVGAAAGKAAKRKRFSMA